ncbi:MAG TPA: glycosyltransferase [Chthoniobacter sp.]|nr:glycosyltransferase [Chthoniobacter sp.]
MIPRLSICIPTYNRPVQLLRCLRTLRGQVLNYPVEIIVADNGAPIPPEARTMAKCIASPSGAPQARNAAAREAAGEILAFLDDDCEPEMTYVAALFANIALLERPDLAGLAGGVRRAQSSHILDNAWLQAGFDRYFEYSATQPRLNWYPTANLIVRRDLFRQVDGFREDIPGRVGGEDIDFCLRLMDHTGQQFQCVPEIRVVHTPVENTSLYQLARKAFWYGRSERWLVRIRPALKTSFWRRGRFLAIHRDWRASLLTMSLMAGNLFESASFMELPASISLSRSAGFVKSE